MAETDGEEANIQPVNTGIAGESGRMSTISRNAVLSGVSVGGFLWQARAMIWRVPKRAG